MTNNFHAYDAALGMVHALRRVLVQLTKKDRALADQLRRAASSVARNIAEGNRRAGQDRLQFFRIAAGSAAEVKAALEVARAWGHIDAAPVAEAELDRVLAMLWRLTHRRE
jgi:four helix bundle protein